MSRARELLCNSERCGNNNNNNDVSSIGLSPMEKLLGTTLVGEGGAEKLTAEALAGKEVVGLYFSAHWCPPCRGFTPKLADAYKGLVAAGKAMEIVFVSSDRDQGSFDEYFGEQPWLALPFSARDTKAALWAGSAIVGLRVSRSAPCSCGKGQRTAVPDTPGSPSRPISSSATDSMWRSTIANSMPSEYSNRSSA